MNHAAVRANQRKLVILTVIVLLCAVGYMFYAVKFNNPKLFQFSMKLRSPNPDYIFVMDRDSAIGATGAQMAQEIMENELIMKTDAYQNGNLVILENPGIWYLAEGGITSLGIMLEDLESALD